MEMKIGDTLKINYYLIKTRDDRICKWIIEELPKEVECIYLGKSVVYNGKNEFVTITSDPLGQVYSRGLYLFDRESIYCHVVQPLTKNNQYRKHYYCLDEHIILQEQFTN